MGAVLVTGAAGAIGSWVAKQLVQAGHQVVLLDTRADFSLLRNLEGRVPFVAGDILDKDLLTGIVRERDVRRIAHLAALMPPTCAASPLLGYRVNVLGALTVFDVARDLGLERVVFASSKAVYGAIGGAHGAPTFAPVTEEYRGQPLDVYGSTKLALEDAARHYRRQWDQDLIALRLGSTYGPGKLERHGAVGLKSAIVESAVRGEPLEVPTPWLTDDVVYNRDVAKAVILACFAPRPEHWQFNISGRQLVTLRAFAEEVMRQCPGHRLTISEGTEAPERPGTNGLFSGERARTELGFVPSFPGVLGVQDYVKHLMEAENRG